MSFKIGPDSIKKGEIVILSNRPNWGNFETIERKGIGHPDTIADTLAAKISHAYSSFTVGVSEGLVLHHQIDKLMVIGGKTKVSFGNGEFVEPIRIIVAGRATYSYQVDNIPVDKIVGDEIKKYFSEYFPLVNFDKDVVIENKLTRNAGPGTITTSRGAIAHMFDPMQKNQVRGYEKLVANDTSCCVAYAPHSPLESAVLKVEKFLNNVRLKSKYTWIGNDIKIMAVRNGKRVSITMCIPQIAKYVPSLEQYLKNLKKIGKVIDKEFKLLLPKHTIDISINTKDDYEKMNVYLTVSGASLSGDIGVAGRGNRTNGLITSARPMSMEGTNGKNPRYYSGFVYGVLTKQVAKEIYERTNEPCVVEIVSQNGGLLKDPWKVRIQCAGNTTIIRKIVENRLNNIENVTKDFLDGNICNS